MRSFVVFLLLTIITVKSTAQVTYVDSLEQLVLNQSDAYQKIEMLNDLVRELLRVSPDRAMEYAQQLIKISDSVKSDVGHAHYFRLMASLNSIEGYYLASSAFVYQAITLYEQLHDSIGVANSYIALANNYSRQKLYRSAIVNQKKALSIFEKLNKQNRIGVCLTNLTFLYYTLSLYDSAKILGERSMRVNGSVHNYPMLANDYKNMGFIGFFQNEFDSATKYFEKALTTSRTLGVNNESEVEAMIGLGKLNYKLGNKRTSYDYFEKAINQAREYGVVTLRRDALIELSNNYFKDGDHVRAYHYLSEHLAAIDSLTQKYRMERAQLGDIYLNALRETDQYNTLKREQELKQKIIKQQSLGIGLGIVSILILIVLVYYLKVSNNTRRQINIVLNSQKIEIAKKNAELEKLIKTKDKFFSIVAHDLRGPLNSLKSFTSLIHKHSEKLSKEEIVETGKQLDITIDNTIKMTESLLTWAKQQMQTDERNPEQIEIAPLTNEIAELFREAADQKSIEIHTEVEPGVTVYADKNHFMFILRNLVNNAVKFTPTGGHIHIIAKMSQVKTQLLVRDSGIGMSKKKQAELFEIRKTQKTYGTAGEKGTGLGLILVKEFALQNNGEIWVESEPEKGSTFIVSLPQG